MKKLCLIWVSFIPFLSLKGQDTYSIINELRSTLQNYKVSLGNIYNKTNEGEVRINYIEPIITIQIIHERTGGNNERIISEHKLSFDVLKSDFSDGTHRYSPTSNKMTIYSPSGIDEYTRVQTIPRGWYAQFARPTDESSKNLKESFYFFAEYPIVKRLVNAFKSLQSIAKEKGVKKSAPNILDDAELVVNNISFVSPDNTNKLKANQTGCIKIEVKNANTNNAFSVACVVKESNKSELFSYEQYTSVDKISGNETEIINIPIKASENVDNSTYPFEVTVSYKGKTLKTQTLNITASNPKKQQSVSNASGGSRNKTVRMRKMAGNTYLISCKVNGLPLDFIFDTGASSVTLSRKQATFMLKNGYLSKSDIIGTNAYQTATGDIAIGAVVKLKKIEINGLVLNNVEASIINSDSAPLLLGQSALSRLGKIQIDYQNSTLTIIR